MPVIGAITGGLDFSNYFTALSAKVDATSLAEAKKQGAVLAWGSFLTVTFNFLVIAFALFGVVNVMQKLKKNEEAQAPAPPPRQEVLLQKSVTCWRKDNQSFGGTCRPQATGAI
jgi:large conductance mechanosensitive channel